MTPEEVHPDGRRIPRWVLVVVAAGLLSIVSAVLLYSYDGPLGGHGEAPPEGRHDLAPVRPGGPRTADTGRVGLSVSDLPGGAARAFVLETDRADLRDGVFTLNASAAPAELTLRFRLDEAPPVRLRPDHALARENTFAAAYREASGPRGAFTAVSAANESWLDVLTQDAVSGRVSGRFSLSFHATCAEGNATCDEAPVLVAGEFPKRREAPLHPLAVLTVAALALLRRRA